MTFPRGFWKEDRGQDLIEYSLLVAFVALAATGLFLSARGSIAGVWTNSSAQLGTANSNLSGS